MKRFLAILKEFEGAPAEFQVLPEGRVEIEGEAPAYLDEAGAREIIAAFERRGNDMVIDYEHQTMTDVQAPAAGWVRVKRLVWRGKDGLWATAVEWTKRAAAYMENREYRYFSPVVAINEKGRIFRLLNIALTNSPRINHLEPIVAKWDAAMGETEKEEIMIEKLRKLLGLAADAGEGEIVEAVTLSINKATRLVACKEVLEALGAKAEAEKEEVVRIVAALKGAPVVACKEVLDALGAQTVAGKDEVLRVIAALKAPGDAAVQLSRQVSELTQKIASMEQQDLVTLALKEGKASPDEIDKWGRDLALKNPESFKLIVLSRPVGSVVPVDRIVVAKDRPAGLADDGQKAINAMCGVDDAAYTQYGPKRQE